MTRIAPPRIDWVERQLLEGADLRAAGAFLDARRARHVRAGHRTWGVALGLDLTVERLPLSVGVGPGLAYDARGRELLVQREVRLPLRRELLVGGGAVVVALRSAGDRCVPVAHARIAGPADPVVPGLDVPLGELDPATMSLDERLRPHVRTLAPPRVGSGTVGPGGAVAQRTGDHVSLVVDTSAAGFETTPYYLVGPAQLPATAPAGVQLLLSIHDPAPDRFSVDVRRAAGTANTLSALSVPQKAGLPFALTWIGVEPAPAAGVLPAGDPPCPCLV